MQRVGLFSKSGRFYTHIPQLGRLHIPAPVLWLMGISAFSFFTIAIITRINGELGHAIQSQLLMPADANVFMKKPWTILTCIFVHKDLWALLLNIIGIIFFGNLTSLLFSHKVVFPLFVSGGLIASASIWIFKLLPLTENLLDGQQIGGASGAVMTLAILSTFYMPEQMMRLYGVYPLKLKFIGRAMLLFSVVAIFFKYEYVANFLHLGGALGGYIFLVMLKRNKLYASPIPFLRKERKIRQSAEVELNGTYKKPISDDEYNEIQISKKEYLDHLLDKISRHGVNSLSDAEMMFLETYGKE